MCHDSSCLLLLLGGMLMGYVLLITLGLRLRRQFLRQNRVLTADQVWASVERRAQRLGLRRQDLIFGIVQDHSATVSSLVIKDSSSDLVATALYPTGSRGYSFQIQADTYKVRRPITWMRTAELLAPDGTILGSYRRTSLWGSHCFSIPGYGIIKARRSGLSLKIAYNYEKDGMLSGIFQEISSRMKIGRLAILPNSLALPVRVFILTLAA